MKTASNRSPFSYKRTTDASWKIWERDKGICVYCGNPASEIDHIVPARLGGRAIVENGVCSCHQCNIFRRDHPENEEYLLKATRHIAHCGQDPTNGIPREHITTINQVDRRKGKRHQKTHGMGNGVRW